jgi:hypothetical protein
MPLTKLNVERGTALAYAPTFIRLIIKLGEVKFHRNLMSSHMALIPIKISSAEAANVTPATGLIFFP